MNVPIWSKSSFFIQIFISYTFYKNIEAKIWSEIFPNTMNSLKFDYGNYPNESLCPESILSMFLGVGVGWEIGKTLIKIKNIRASADIYWFS